MQDRWFVRDRGFVGSVRWRGNGRGIGTRRVRDEGRWGELGDDGTGASVMLREVDCGVGRGTGYTSNAE